MAKDSAPHPRLRADSLLPLSRAARTSSSEPPQSFPGMPVKIISLDRSFAVRFSPNGKLCAVIYDGIHLFDARTGRTVTRLPDFFHATSIAFSPDGRSLVAKNPDGEAVVGTTTPSGEMEWSTFASEEGPGPEFSFDGHALVDPSTRKGLIVRNLLTGEIDFAHHVPNVRTSDLLCSAARNRWITAHCDAKKGKAMEPTRFLQWEWPFDPTTCIELPYRVKDCTGAALSPDGELLATVFAPDEDEHDTLQIYSISRRMILHAQPGGNGPGPQLRWSPCSRYLGWVTAEGFSVLDFKRRTIVAEYEMSWPSSIDFSPDLSRIALGSTDGGRIEPFAPFGRPVSRR